jgi:hypothetical protein
MAQTPTDRWRGRDARYDILFEAVKVGPVTAKNRFFQVPHSIQGRLLELGVRLIISHRVVAYKGDGSVVTITSRLPNDELYEAHEISAQQVTQ